MSSDEMPQDPDTAYTPGSEREDETLQRHAASSPALDDPEIDKGDVTVLPGTGGPDDPGDVETGDLETGDLEIDGDQAD